MDQEQLWDQLTIDFREACLLRREGKQDEAGHILQQELPQTIAHWSRVSPTKPTTKKAQLQAMFAEEQKRVDSALVVQQVVTRRLTEQLVPSLSTQVADQVRHVVSEQIHYLRNVIAEAALVGALRVKSPAAARPRVKFDDIPGVIDAALAEQEADHGPQPGPSFH